VLIFPYGVSRNKIERAIHNLRLSATIARNWDDADVVLTLKTLERKESKLRQIAAENVPIYSIKTNTTTQIQNALKDVFNLPPIDVEEVALREAEEAIYLVMLNNQAVELSPQTSYVRRMQHDLAARLYPRGTGGIVAFDQRLVHVRSAVFLMIDVPLLFKDAHRRKNRVVRQGRRRQCFVDCRNVRPSFDPKLHHQTQFRLG